MRRFRIARRAAAAFLALIVAVGVGEAAAGALSGEKLVMPFGWGAARVLSGSMEPTFSEGSLLVVSRVASSEEVSAGDIVVYDAGRSLVAHRVVEVSGGVAVTQGDANNAPDDPVELSQVKARVVAWIPPFPLFGGAFGETAVSARFASRAQAEDAARPARFAWSVRSSAPDGSDIAIRPGETVLLDIEASNARGNRVSEVSQTCTARAACEGEVPLGLSFGEGGASEAGDALGEGGAFEACAFAAFPAGEPESRAFHLAVSLPADVDAVAIEGAESQVRVTVVFEQAHDAASIAGVEARYAHEETLDFTLHIEPALQ